MIACIGFVSCSIQSRSHLYTVTATCFTMSSTDYKIETSSNHSHLERARTAGGHIEDRSQPALPVIHRRLANPAPLGLLSFATGELATWCSLCTQ